MLESMERIVISNDWLTILFVVSLVIIAITKTLYGKRFTLFLMSPITKNYQNTIEHKKDDKSYTAKCQS